jgi:hypothetical protein
MAGLGTLIVIGVFILAFIMRAAPSDAPSHVPPAAELAVPSEVAAASPRSPIPASSVEDRDHAEAFGLDEPVAKAYAMPEPPPAPGSAFKKAPAAVAPRTRGPRREPSAPQHAPAEPPKESSPDLGY